MKKIRARAVKALTATAAALGMLILGATAASAHVTVDPSTTQAGAYSILTFSVPHGCDGSPTTGLAIKIPEGVNSVTPTVNPNWTIKKKIEKLDTPLDDGHGGKITERVDQVIYTAKTPLPADLRDTLELSVQLPSDADSKLAFPTIQTCEKGETAWIEKAAAGQDEPEHPAPAITLTAGSDQASPADAADQDPASPADASDQSAGGTSAVSWIALGLAAVAVILGGIAVIRRPSQS